MNIHVGKGEIPKNGTTTAQYVTPNAMREKGLPVKCIWFHYQLRECTCFPLNVVVMLVLYFCCCPYSLESFVHNSAF